MPRRQSSLLLALLVIVALFLLYRAYGSPLIGSKPGAATPTAIGTGTEPKWGVQTKTSGCVAHGGLADSACTPGALLASGTKDAICRSGYASSVRNVPTSEKDQVYVEYGISHHTPGEYEVDHLVSLELGGSNDIANLWPEAASPKPGFHEKDKVENYLHDQVCANAISLREAQIEIATNWLAVYNRMPNK
ncbi:MAG: HNH endonuclease [Ktedonobacteraceae bacterium]|nr:HNH endonuclease [Ktedonobacteraceae bacterium]